MTIVHALRILASYSLLGAVIAGIAFGWSHRLSFDPRWVGIAIGVLVGLTVTFGRRPRQRNPEPA